MAEENNPSVVPAPAEGSKYEYVEVPETDAIQFEYVDQDGNPIPPEMINGADIQFEYVDQNGNPVDENGNPIDPANVQYEYVEQEVPAPEEDILAGYDDPQPAQNSVPESDLSVESLGEVENTVPPDTAPTEVYEYVDENGNPVDPSTLENGEYVYEEVEVPATETAEPVIPAEQEMSVADLETPLDEVPVPEVVAEPELPAEQEMSVADLETPLDEVPVPEVVAEPELPAEQEMSVADLETPLDEVPVPEVATEPAMPVEQEMSVADLETPLDEVPVPEVVAEPELPAEQEMSVADLETPLDEVPVPEVVAEPQLPAEQEMSVADLETPLDEVPVPEVVTEPAMPVEQEMSVADLETPLDEVPVPEVATEPAMPVEQEMSVADLETPLDEVPVPEVVTGPAMPVEQEMSVADLETPLDEVPVPEVVAEPAMPVEQEMSVADLETPLDEVPVPEVVTEPAMPVEQEMSVADLETPLDEVPAPEVSAEPELPPEEGYVEEGVLPDFESTPEPDLPSEEPVVQESAVEADAMDEKIARITEMAETIATTAFVFNGEQTESSDSAEIVLDNSKGMFNSLKNWYLLITEMSVSQIEGQGGQVIDLTKGVYNQGFFITGDGEQINFANVDKVEVPVREIDSCTLFVSSTMNTTLAEQAGQTIELENSSGVLLGPNGVQLSFSHLNKITVPNVVEESVVEAPVRNQHFESSSRPVAVAMLQEVPKETSIFVFDENSGEKMVQGGTILVKTGYSLYGWNVRFDNGLTMSLADVRTFESLNNDLPARKGEITYKNAKLTFDQIEQIKVYEQPAYCGYGVNS